MRSLILRFAAWAAGVLPEGWRQALYRTGPFALLLRSVLAGAAPTGLTQVQVAAGPLAGARLWLDLKVEKSFWLGNYEPHLMHAIQHFGRPGMVAYDVGANIGYVSLALARRAGPAGSVVAFEPLPDNLSRLRKNLALNTEGEWILVVDAAVADRSGRAEFLVHHSVAMGRLVNAVGKDLGYEAKLTVDQLALDEWQRSQQAAPPLLVKIDVEGGEALVLQGMRLLLAEQRPIVLMELHGDQAARASLALLRSAGYQAHAMRRGYPEFRLGSSRRSYIVAVPAGIDVHRGLQ